MREGVVQKHVSGDSAAAGAARQIDSPSREAHLFFFHSHLQRSYGELANH